MKPSIRAAETVSILSQRLRLFAALALMSLSVGAIPSQHATRTPADDTAGRAASPQAPSTPPRINTITTIKVPSASAVRTVRFQFRAGSMLDTTGKEGVSQLAARILAHRLFLEAKHTRASFQWIVEKEWAAFEFSMTPGKKPGPWVLFAAQIEKTPSPTEFKRALDEQRESLSRDFKSPQGDNTLLLLQEFQNYRRSYRFPISGTLTSLSAITSEDVFEFWKDRYTQTGLALLYSDNLPPTELEETTRNLGTLRVQTNDTFIFNAPAREAEKVLKLSKYSNCSSPRLAAGFPLLLNRQHPYYAALLVAEFSSNKFKLKLNGSLQMSVKEREKNSLESTAPDLFTWGLDRQILLCQISTDTVLPGEPELSLGGLILDFSAWAQNGLTPKQFQKSQLSLLHVLESIKKSSQGPMCNAALSMQDPQSLGYIDELIKNVRQLNLSNVNEAIKKVLTPQGLECTILSVDSDLHSDQKVPTGKPSPKSGAWPFRCTMDEAREYLKSCTIEHTEAVPLSPTVIELGNSLVK